MAKWTADQQREHRKLWVEALRSGKYQQTTGRLRDNDGGMCCLGVVCDISGLGEWTRAGHYFVGEFRNYAMTPDPVMDWIGLVDCAGYFRGNSLTSLNDAGKTFAEIADIIESEPEGLIVAPPEAA